MLKIVICFLVSGDCELNNGKKGIEREERLTDNGPLFYIHYYVQNAKLDR